MLIYSFPVFNGTQNNTWKSCSLLSKSNLYLLIGKFYLVQNLFQIFVFNLEDGGNAVYETIAADLA